MTQRLCQVFLLLLIVCPAFGQTPADNTPRPSFESFLSKFDPIDLPLEIDQPLVDVDSFPTLSDEALRKAYLDPHAVGTNVEHRIGHVFSPNDQFVGVTVLVSLAGERTWFLLTYTPSGEAISKGIVAAHLAYPAYTYGHWSTILPNLSVEQSSLTRFVDDSGETTSCSVRNWSVQLNPSGEIDRSGEESAVEGEECQ